MGRKDDNYDFMGWEKRRKLELQENYVMNDGKLFFKEVNQEKAPLPIDNEFLKRQLALAKNMGMRARLDRIKKRIIAKSTTTIRKEIKDAKIRKHWGTCRSFVENSRRSGRPY